PGSRSRRPRVVRGVRVAGRGRGQRFHAGPQLRPLSRSVRAEKADNPFEDVMTIFLFIAVAFAFVGAVIDWRTGHIPNTLTLGALSCAALPLLMYARGGMGGGDVKLFAAIGALALPLAGLEAQTYAFISALFIAPARLAYDGVLLRTVRNAFTMFMNPFRRAS